MAGEFETQGGLGAESVSNNNNNNGSTLQSDLEKRKELALETERKGNEAFVDEDFDTALQNYCEAISLDPSNASFYIRRAQVHIKLSNFTDSLTDANKAIGLNPNITKAYIYKGNALFLLEEYQAAKSAFSKGLSLEPQSSLINNWIQKCNTKLAEEAASSMEHKPEEVSPVLSRGVECERKDIVHDTNSTNSTDSRAVLDSMEKVTPSMVTALTLPPPKFRHSFYQSSNKVVVTIFAKGVKKEDCHVDFGEQQLVVAINLPNEDPYRLQERLFAKIVPSQCEYHIFSTKIEIHLVKVESIQWETLDYQQRPIIAPRLHSVSSDPKIAKYPSSSKKAGQKDWSKIEAEIKKEEKNEKLDGDAALNKVFRDIFANADDDTRRAMKKSFVESNGTVLSTNWKEVGGKKVEGIPPQGMEMKKWEM